MSTLSCLLGTFGVFFWTGEEEVVAKVLNPFCDNSGRCFCRTRKRARAALLSSPKRQEKQTQILETPDRFHGNKHSQTGHNTPGHFHYIFSFLFSFTFGIEYIVYSVVIT